MRIGVPGEFHEDRWPRTAEDSERRVLPRTREASGPSDTSYRVAKRSSDRSSAGLWHDTSSHNHLSGIPSWRRGLLDGLRHDAPFHNHLSAIPAWRRGTSDRSSARRPTPQVPQWHPRVAKGVFRPVFGTESRPTDASMGSSRCHCELVHRIVALLGFVKFTWNEPLLIIK